MNNVWKCTKKNNAKKFQVCSPTCMYITVIQKTTALEWSINKVWIIRIRHSPYSHRRINETNNIQHLLWLLKMIIFRILIYLVPIDVPDEDVVGFVGELLLLDNLDAPREVSFSPWFLIGIIICLILHRSNARRLILSKVFVYKCNKFFLVEELDKI